MERGPFTPPPHLLPRLFNVKKSPAWLGLTIAVVVILETFLQLLESKDMSEARIVNAAPLTYRKYVDNSHARF